MNSPPVKRRGGDWSATTPNCCCFGLDDDTPLVCSAQPWSECEHANTRIEQLANGPHFAKEFCTDCGRVLRFVPKPQTIERHRLNAFRLARLAMCHRLTHRERHFVAGISHRQKISPKQQQIIDRLCREYLEGKPQ